jgi:glycosyltransferase involved in cell wall biosynthesis
MVEEHLMTRVLVLSPKFLYPLTEGGRVGIHHMVHELVRRGVDLHFAAPYGLPGSPDGFPPGVTVHRLKANAAKNVVGAVRNLFRPLPYYIEKFFSPEALDQLDLLAKQEKFDILQAETLFLAPYAMALREKWNIPFILRQHNVESEIVRLYRDRAGNPAIRWYAGYEYHRLARYEAEVLSKADLVVPHTRADEAAMRAMAPDMRSTVIPVGVDCSTFRPLFRWIPESVLMLTNARWPPNRDSLDFFVEEIVPRVLERRPQARILLAGNETESLRQILRGKPVEVLGFIPDLNTLPSLATVAVIPLRIGSGIRIKLLHQMALGLATVSTTLGAEGVGAVPDRHLVIADGPEDFSKAICDLLDDPDRSLRIGRSAREFVESEFSVPAIGSQYLKIYASLQENSRG